MPAIATASNGFCGLRTAGTSSDSFERHARAGQPVGRGRDSDGESG